MIKIFKKFSGELMDDALHLSAMPEQSGDPAYNLSELVELSKRNHAGFKIIGDHTKFTVAAKSAVVNFMAAMILLYPIFVIGLAIFLKEPALWVIAVLGTLLILLALKFGQLLFYNVIVDTYSRKITIESNNAFGFVGKWLRPGFEIDFSRFQKFSSETKVRRGRADVGAYLPRYINRIYIEYDQQKRPVIDFRDNINHHIFIICLTRLIKGGA